MYVTTRKMDAGLERLRQRLGSLGFSEDRGWHHLSTPAGDVSLTVRASVVPRFQIELWAWKKEAHFHIVSAECGSPEEAEASLGGLPAAVDRMEHLLSAV